MLAEAIRDASITTYSEKVGKMLSSPKPVGILLVFEKVREALLQAANLPHDLKDAIDIRLSPIFQHARARRNDHGHPTGTPVTAEEADSGLRLFPDFYALVDELIQYLRTTFPS